MRRRAVLAIAALALAAGLLALGLVARGGSDTARLAVRSGALSVTPWFPPEGWATSLQSASMEPGYLWLHNDQWLGDKSLRKFSVAGESPAITETTLSAPEDRHPVHLSPDGVALTRIRGRGVRGYYAARFGSSSADYDEQAVLPMPPRTDSGPTVYRDGALYYFERLTPGAPGPVRVMRLEADGAAPVEVRHFPDILRHGYAWDGDELTLAAFLTDGSFWRLEGAPLEFRRQPQCDALGQRALALVGRRSFWLADDFGVFGQGKDDYVCLSLTGDRLDITGRDPGQVDPLGKPRGWRYQLRQAVWQQLPRDRGNASALEFYAREGRRAPGDVNSGSGHPTLADRNLVVIGDRDYRRMLLIRHD